MREEAKVGLWALVGMVACVVLVVGLAVGIFAFRWFTAGPRGELQAREQILSGDFRIQAYDHFFDLCASAQTIEQTLDASRAEQKVASAADQERLRINITGQEAALARAVNQYNADARKSYTAGQFRSSDLPYQLSSEGAISCVG